MDRELEVARSVYDRLASATPVRAPGIRAWDGSEWGPSSSHSTIVLQHPGALRALLLPPTDLTAGEAYAFDDVDIEGDIYEALRWAESLTELRLGRIASLRIARDLRTLPEDCRRNAARRPVFRGRFHSKRRDHDVVSYHYDIGNDFYRLFLGDTMTYSCGCFLDPDEDLDVAQRRKLDVVCRKLELAPGRRLLDIGSGWGSLVIHAAARYGVCAVGVTVAGEQAAYAREAARSAGVDDRVEIVEGDYRDVEDRFDAIASIGMVEHVGRKKLPEYFATVRGLLEPGGVFLNHGITTRQRSRRHRPTFVSTYVFPDGELVPIDVRLSQAEQAGFDIRDVESIRMSYAHTLRAWVRNLEREREAAVEETSDRVYRIWRAYMAGSVLGFESGHIGVYQAVLADAGRPWRYGRRRLLATDDA